MQKASEGEKTGAVGCKPKWATTASRQKQKKKCEMVMPKKALRQMLSPRLKGNLHGKTERGLCPGSFFIFKYSKHKINQ